MTALPDVAVAMWVFPAVMWVFTALSPKCGDLRARCLFLGAAVASTWFAVGLLIAISHI